ncbi:uncharacterized protein LOC106007866 [Heterocephalus glaber]|uniref:Uncharacterized protein LOC106007866 n=1 Tax=Heterocephalus glaber TaxID=10181 RepID=A0AAX6RVR1_HETGA|nr:uncharacterized protein LOC106007866 [Heterocephalus glaber]
MKRVTARKKKNEPRTQGTEAVPGGDPVLKRAGSGSALLGGHRAAKLRSLGSGSRSCLPRTRPTHPQDRREACAGHHPWEATPEEEQLEPPEVYIHGAHLPVCVLQQRGLEMTPAAPSSQPLCLSSTLLGPPSPWHFTPSKALSSGWLVWRERIAPSVRGLTEATLRTWLKTEAQRVADLHPTVSPLAHSAFPAISLIKRALTGLLCACFPPYSQHQESRATPLHPGNNPMGVL